MCWYIISKDSFFSISVSALAFTINYMSTLGSWKYVLGEIITVHGHSETSSLLRDWSNVQEVTAGLDAEPVGVLLSFGLWEWGENQCLRSS